MSDYHLAYAELLALPVTTILLLMACGVGWLIDRRRERQALVDRQTAWAAQMADHHLDVDA